LFAIGLTSAIIPFFVSPCAYAQDFGEGNDPLPPPTHRKGDLALPPSWRTPDPVKKKGRGGEGLPPHLSAGRKQRTAAANDSGLWNSVSEMTWMPDLAFGVGVNIPEVLPLDAHLVFGRWFRLRFFYGPPMPFKARVEMPSDLISAKNGVAVANPDFVIRMNAVYGPSYGVEAMVFPFVNSFFIAGGISARSFQLSGTAKSGVLVCSEIEAAKEPPCGDPSARLTTRTELVVTAKAKTSSNLLRLSTGWLWQIADSGFFSVYAGAARPVGIRRKVSVTTGIDSHGGEGNEAISGALAQLKVDKESELESKALKEMAPYDEKTVPILGIGGGIQF